MADLPDLPKAEIAIVEMTNTFRTSNGLGTVKPEPKLTEAARLFARYLAESGRFAHEADGRRPEDRAKAAGYAYCIVAENLASALDSRGFRTESLARKAVDGWRDSPPHRENMLLPHVTEIGIGIARAPTADPKFVSVQLLGRPEKEKLRFRIENRTGVHIDYVVGKRMLHLEAGMTATHTICEPATLGFAPAPAATIERVLTARHQARDGAVFTLTRKAEGSLEVEVTAAPQRR